MNVGINYQPINIKLSKLSKNNSISNSIIKKCDLPIIRKRDDSENKTENEVNI